MLYQKSKLLYALNWSKARIVTDDRAIVCEGYTDVIGFARAGLPAAVATCGTALTDGAREAAPALRPQARARLRRRLRRPGGRRALLPVGEGARPRGHGRRPARRASIRPTSPRTDPERLAASVEGAVPFLKFRVDRVLDGGRPRAPSEGRARAAEAAVDGDPRAPERARPRPVRDGGGRPHARRATSSSARCCGSPPAAARARRRAATAARGARRAPRGRATSATVPSSRCCAT